MRPESITTVRPVIVSVRHMATWMRLAFDTTGVSIIGTEAAIASAPEGYTMLFGYNQLVTLNRLLFRRLPCDPDRMTRVGLVSDAPFVMLVPKDLPATAIAEFGAYSGLR